MAEATASPPALTTLIFIPGAWHLPTCYDPVIEHLKSGSNGSSPNASYNIVKIPLPSVSCPPSSLSMTSWQPDVDAVLHVLEAEMAKSASCGENKGYSRNVLVISHSYGSLVANEALGCLNLSRTKASTKTNLQQLILCGFILDVGSAMRDKASSAPYPGLWDVRGEIVYPSSDAPDWFYQDLSEPERRNCTKNLEGKYMPLASFTSAARFAAWKTVPTTYLHCENDRTVPLPKQEGMVSAAKRAGGLIETARVVSGHSPFLVVPQEVAGVIRRLTS